MSDPSPPVTALAGGSIPPRPPEPSALLHKLQQALGDSWSMVEQLGAVANELGWTPWIVGGGVRDLLLDRPLRDVDVVVEGDGPALARAVAKRLGGSVMVHKAFRTAKWTPPGWSENLEPIDIASARSESYPRPAALPVVQPASLTRDLHRRDFTVNAMAVCLAPGEIGQLLDPLGGWSDLRLGLLRVLHEDSFRDDPTRALRAVRFAARFQLRRTPHTARLLEAAVQEGSFAALTTERLGAEVDRLLREPDPSTALEKLRSWGLLGILHPEWRIDDALLQTLDRVRSVAEAAMDSEPAAFGTGQTASDWGWVVLAGGLAAPLRAARSGLVPGTKDRRARFVAGPEVPTEALSHLQQARQHSEVARAVAHLDPVQWVVALGLATAEADGPRLASALWWWQRTGQHLRSTVDGHRLMAHGFPPGPRIRLAIEAALDVARNGGADAEQLEAAMSVRPD